MPYTNVEMLDVFESIQDEHADCDIVLGVNGQPSWLDDLRFFDNVDDLASLTSWVNERHDTNETVTINMVSFIRGNNTTTTVALPKR